MEETPRKINVPVAEDDINCFSAYDTQPYRSDLFGVRIFVVGHLEVSEQVNE